MELFGIELIQFRNYEKISLHFEKPLIFFIGDNGSGKTNLLEAIGYLSFAKSFRMNTDEEVLAWNQKFFSIHAKLQKQNVDYQVQYGFQVEPQRRKKIKINEDTILKKEEYLGFFPIIILSPNDLKLIDDGDVERRKYIDQIIAFQDKYYTKSLLDYSKIIKNRNLLLKNKASDSEIHAWNEPLLKTAQVIIEKRKETLETLNVFYREDVQKISDKKDVFEIIYHPKSPYDTLKENLLKSLEKDRAIGYTSVGPHRDKIFIGFEGKDLTEFGSQGQKRSTAISLKIASYLLLEAKLRFKPILLIDDIIRELDIRRRENFLSLIMNCGQAFFTTTDLEGISQYVGERRENIQIFHVSSGTVS